MAKADEKIFILKKIKSFFVKDKINYKLFFCTYVKNIGFFFIHFFSKKKLDFFSGLKIILKDILYSSYYGDMRLHYPKKIINNYQSIVVSWGFKRNFNKNGLFNDEILNCNSNTIKNNLWFIIYQDKDLPIKIQNNIILLIPFLRKKINIFFFFRKFFKNIFCYKAYSIVLNLQLFSSFSIFAETSNIYFKKFLNKKLKFIFMPYEAQPFQNLFFMSSKKVSKKIKTIGYIHSPPEAFPVQSIYKNGSPDKIILNGKDQVHCYKNLLGWKKSKILNLPSIRFKNKKTDIYNKIFLPYSISNESDIIKNLDYLYYEKKINIKKFKIQPHPLTKKIIDIKKFIKKILNIKKRNLLFKKDHRMSIFIGASGAVAECLERGVNAIHISDNPTTDFYSPAFYPSIKVDKMRYGVHKYRLTRKNFLLNLGAKTNNLKKYLHKF